MALTQRSPVSTDDPDMMVFGIGIHTFGPLVRTCVTGDSGNRPPDGAACVGWSWFQSPLGTRTARHKVGQF